MRTQEAFDVVSARRREAQDFPRTGLHVQVDPDVVFVVLDHAVQRRQSLDYMGDRGQTKTTDGYPVTPN